MNGHKPETNPGRRRLQVGTALVAILALGLVGTGVWLIHPPTALIVVGVLLWADLFVENLKT
ncbi:MAG TPA: hypothetical protein VMY35_08600 [Phycisphaerae bacterium]|nr:hypothetical protein [Phycisphaerae bacterium]